METFKYPCGENLRNFRGELKTKKDRIWTCSTQTLRPVMLNDKDGFKFTEFFIVVKSQKQALMWTSFPSKILGKFHVTKLLLIINIERILSRHLSTKIGEKQKQT